MTDSPNKETDSACHDTIQSSTHEEIQFDHTESSIYADARINFQDLVRNSNAKYKTSAEVNEIIEVLSNWDKGDDAFPTVSEYRKANKNGYYWISYFKVQIKVLDNRTIRELHVLSSSHGSQFVPLEELFDIILNCHVNGAVHQKARRTHNLIKKQYANISERVVEMFIRNCCIVCNMKIKPKKSLKGASNPIKSLQFRARYQADLIDYRHDPQLDHNGVEMRWLLVIKDHFTKKCWLRPLAFKRASLVAQELYTLFCDIGWPLIFQSDNGKEFTAKVMTALFKLNPFVITVWGRARKPSDQGSVERLNQQIKRAICSAIEDLKMQNIDKDYNPSWLEVLPRVAAGLNNTVSSASGLITPYMHVFGVDYDCPVIAPIGPLERSKITTVKQLIEYGNNDPVLMESLRQQQYYPEKIMNLDPDDDDDDTDSDDDDDDRESDDESIHDAVIEHNSLNTQILDVSFTGINVSHHKTSDFQNPSTACTDIVLYRPLFPVLPEFDGSLSVHSECSLNIEPFSKTPPFLDKHIPNHLVIAEQYEKDLISSSDSNCSLDIEPIVKISESKATKELVKLPAVTKVEKIIDDNNKLGEEHATFKQRSRVPLRFEDIDSLHEVITELQDDSISPIRLRKRIVRNNRAIQNQFRCIGKHAHVSCSQCAQQTDMESLNVSESKLYDYFVRNKTAWFESNIIELFTLLQIHETHPQNVYFLFLIDPILADDSFFKSLKPITLGKEVDKIVSIGCNGQHFCTIELIPASKRVHIYDGLKMPFSTWKKSLRYAFRRLGVSEEQEIEWHTRYVNYLHGQIIHQYDSHNCGPIACMVLWGLINPSNEKFRDAWGNFRGSVRFFRAKIVEYIKEQMSMAHSLFSVSIVETVTCIDTAPPTTPKVKRKPEEITYVKSSDDESDESRDEEKMECIVKKATENILVRKEASLSSSRKKLKVTSQTFKLDEKVDIENVKDKSSVKYYFQLMASLRMNNQVRQIAQDKQAVKMKRFRGESVLVKIGDIVNIRIPIVDKAPCKTLDVIGIVFNMRLNTKTIAVVTEHGILAYGGKGQDNKHILFLTPVSDFEVVSQHIPISIKLSLVRRQILACSVSSTKFDCTNYPLVSRNFVHKMTYGNIIQKTAEKGWGQRKCKCKGKCNPKRCGCLLNNLLCSSGCGCGGTCKEE